MSEIKITNECNMQLMARYSDDYFDLAIVDPPYGIGYDSDAKRKADYKGKNQLDIFTERPKLITKI